jgi:hypothetical protein
MYSSRQGAHSRASAIRGEVIAVVAALAALAFPAGASAGIFGTDPLNISVTPGGGAANGDSGAPAVSGDDRKTRLAAFQSDASNLVGGDSNGVTDVFVWSRPRGSEGLRLPRGAGSLQRVSVGPGGGQANGASRAPSLDGSIRRSPHCVAFESDASNLAGGDGDPATDVFVRDLRARKTFLVSRGITAPATQPSIDGSCSRVAFSANGQVLVAPVRGGKPHALGPGSNPDFSLDGTAVTWQKGGGIALSRDGRESMVAPSGQNPTVSDGERLHGQSAASYGVSFEALSALTGRDHNPGWDMYMRVLGGSGGVKETDLISASARGAGSLGGDNYNGGITAYGPNRGILVFTHTRGPSTDLYYRNNHSGNIDDLAHSAAVDSLGGINEVQTSARANFVAFSSAYSGDLSQPFGGARGGLLQNLFADHRHVYFKHLVDGERL